MAKLYKRNNIWCITDGKGSSRKRFSLHTTNKRVAERIYQKYVDNKELKKWGLDPDPEDRILSEFFHEYQKAHVKVHSYSWSTRQRQVINNFLAFVEVELISDVTPGIINNYIQHRSQVVKPKTINMEVDVLGGIFEYAINANYIKSNPFKSPAITIPRIKERHYPLFSPDQIAEILSWECKYSLYYRSLLLTGLRAMDCASLTRKNIDRKNSVIIVQTQKTGSTSYIPIHPAIRELTERDDPIFSDNPKSYWKKAYDYLKKQVRANGWDPDLTLHSFRVTFNNLLRDNGLGFEDRKAILGHSSSEVHAVYTRPNLDFTRNIIERIQLPECKR